MLEFPSNQHCSSLAIYFLALSLNPLTLDESKLFNLVPSSFSFYHSLPLCHNLLPFFPSKNELLNTEKEHWPFFKCSLSSVPTCLGRLLGKEVRFQGGSEAHTMDVALPACVSGQTCVGKWGARSLAWEPWRSECQEFTWDHHKFNPVKGFLRKSKGGRKLMLILLTKYVPLKCSWL